MTTTPSKTARSLFCALVLCAAGSIASPAVAQGETGFLRGEGHLDLVFGYTLDTYDEFWIGSDKTGLPDVGRVDRQGYGLYAAYGLCDTIDLIASGSYVTVDSDGLANFDDEKDFQDLLLAAKWRVLEARRGRATWSLSLLPGIKLPLSDYEDNAVTAIGDGQVDLRARVVGHVQLDNGAFASLETGYDRRNDVPDDEFPLHLTVGATLGGTLTVAPFLSRIDSLGGTDIGDPGGFTPNEEDILRAGVGLYVRLNESFGLTGNYRTTLDGRNTGDVEGYSLGLVIRL